MTGQGLEHPSAAGDRRTGMSRRRGLHRAEWRAVLGGRRRTTRRSGDGGVFAVDRYPAPLLAAALAAFGLSALDAHLTLQLLERGLAVEGNPVMAALLDIDVRLFVNLKTALTAVCLVFLVLLSGAPLRGALRIRHCLYTIVGVYAVLVGYELTLIV